MAVATQPRPPFSGFHATCPDHVGEVPTRSKSVAIDPRSPLFGSTATCPGLVRDCVGMRTGSRHHCFGDESQLFLKSIKTTHYILSPTVTAVTPLESIHMKASTLYPKFPFWNSPLVTHQCSTPFFSTTYKLPILQALSFEIHPSNGGYGGYEVAFLKNNFDCTAIPMNSEHLIDAQTTDGSPAAISGALASSSSRTTGDCQLKTTSKKSRAMAVIGSGGNAHAAKFIVVILLMKDVPLLAAFEDFFFLRSDSFAHFQFDFLFVFQCGSQNLHHLLANRVAIVNEFNFFAFHKYFSDLVREPYNFFAGEARRFSNSSYEIANDCMKRMMKLRRRLKPTLQRLQNRLAKDQLAVPRQLLLHLLVHLLIRDAGPPHLVLMVDQDLPHFIVEPVLDRELFQHALPDAVSHGRGTFGLDLPAFHQPFHNLVGHVRYKVPYDKHPRAFPLHQYKRVSLLAALIKCKESPEIARKFKPALAQLYPEGSRTNSPRPLGKSCKHWREFRKGDGSIRRRVDAACRFLYDELGMGA